MRKQFDNRRTSGVGRSFAEFSRSQLFALQGRNNSRPGIKDAHFVQLSRDAEKNRLDVATALSFLPMVGKSLNLSMVGLTPAEQKLAVSLATRHTSNGGGLDSVVHIDRSPKLRNAIFLLIIFALLLVSCQPTAPIDATAPPPTQAAEVSPPTEEAINEDLSKVTGIVTPSPEPETEASSESETGQLLYPSTYSEWVNIDDYDEDRILIEGDETTEGYDPEGLKQAEILLRDQAREQGISVDEILVKVTSLRYSVVIRDTEGVIWYAVGADNNLPYAQLFPFGATSRDQWKLASNLLNNDGNSQDLIESKSGLFFSVEERDADGNPVEWVDLATGKTVEIQQGVEWTTVENVESCANNPLNDQDMEPGGRVDQYWAQIKPRLMEETNWDIIKDDIPFGYFSGSIIYSTEKNEGVKFVNPELDLSAPDTNPFDRDIDAFALYTAENGRRYCFIPLVIRDINAPTETGHDLYLLKLLLPLQKNDGTPLTQSELDYMFKNWNERMNMAPIGITDKPMDKLSEDDDGADAKDPTFAHLSKGTPEREALSTSLKILVTRELVSGQISEFKKLQGYIFPTNASNLTDADGTPNHTYE